MIKFQVIQTYIAKEKVNSLLSLAFNTSALLPIANSLLFLIFYSHKYALSFLKPENVLSYAHILACMCKYFPVRDSREWVSWVKGYVHV